jgi:hypothetical protein
LRKANDAERPRWTSGSGTLSLAGKGIANAGPNEDAAGAVIFVIALL